MPTAHVDGCSIYYEVQGGGPPLVFVHGGFGGAGTGLGVGVPPWREMFAQHFQVITYDRRSAGRSGYPTTPHSIAVFADDVRALLRHLGIERAAVMGTSAGGPIVIEFALRHPEALSCLVVTESAPRFFPNEDDRRRLRERVALLETAGADAAYEARRTGGTVGIQSFSPARPADGDGDQHQRDARRAAIQHQLATLTRADRVKLYAGELRNYSAYVEYDATERLPQIQAPTLVVQATGDTIFPPSLVDWPALVSGMANASYVPLIGGEHGAVSTDPVSLQTILAFVRTHAPDVSADRPARVTSGIT